MALWGSIVCRVVVPGPHGRERLNLDPRDVFMRDLDLPRGRERETVYDVRERAYTLRGSETRTLSTVGAFRVVSAEHLRDHDGRSSDPRRDDLRHLEDQGLVHVHRLEGHRNLNLHPEAARDITEIWEYVAADNPAAAGRVREEILEAIRNLVSLPR
jgi:hypothetical protein